MDTDEIFGMSPRTSHATQPQLVNKHKNLFDELEKAESVNKHRIANSEEPMDSESTNRGSLKRKRSETKHLRGKESIFKRPEEPLSKCLPVRQVPGFKKNPNKWTKYSLDTVKVEDTSDRGNTAAALSFLRELEERKSQNPNAEDHHISEKPVFHTTALISDDNSNETDEKVCFKGSKIVMPEYVVGQKKKTMKKNIIQTNDSQKKIEIKLDHLLEEEDE